MNHSIILFDGVCNFCNGMVNFAIRQDKKDVLRFAALQSESGQKILEQYNLKKSDFDSFIFIDEGRVYKNSTAALRVADKFSWYWKWTKLFWLIPAFLRDAVYNLIAKNRYKWFGQKEECMIPTPKMKKKFLT